MIPLLVMAGLLLLASGAVKLKAAQRARLGVPLLPVVELFAGLLVPAYVMVSSPDVDTGFRIVLGAVGLVLASSASMAWKLSVARREREESEGARLVTYVKYLSGQEDGPEE